MRVPSRRPRSPAEGHSAARGPPYSYERPVQGPGAREVLEGSQHRVCGADGEATARLHHEGGDDPVFDDGRISLRTDSEAGTALVRLETDLVRYRPLPSASMRMVFPTPWLCLQASIT